MLVRCLESLARQTLPTDAFEVIVVDNASSDATADVASRYEGALNLRYVFAPEPGLHVGRHAGCSVASSEILIYADDDIEAEPTWVEAVVDAFRDSRVGLVGGNNLPRFESAPPEWLNLLWSRRVRLGRALPYLSILDFGGGRFAVDPHYVWGCNFSVRRDVLRAAGGFHPDSLPQELLKLRGDGESHVAKFVAGRGLITLFDSAASVYHFVGNSRMTQDYFERRGYAQGISDSYSAVRSAGAPRTSFRQTIYAHLRPVVAGLRERLHALGGQDSAHRSLVGVQVAALNAWRKGYLFHQAAVLQDASLLEWVLKESYL